MKLSNRFALFSILVIVALTLVVSVSVIAAKGGGEISAEYFGTTIDGQDVF